MAHSFLFIYLLHFKKDFRSFLLRVFAASVFFTLYLEDKLYMAA